jgi:hypothetical protein
MPAAFFGHGNTMKRPVGQPLHRRMTRPVWDETTRNEQSSPRATTGPHLPVDEGQRRSLSRPVPTRRRQFATQQGLTSKLVLQYRLLGLLLPESPGSSRNAGYAGHKQHQRTYEQEDVPRSTFPRRQPDDHGQQAGHRHNRHSDYVGPLIHSRDASSPGRVQRLSGAGPPGRLLVILLDNGRATACIGLDLPGRPRPVRRGGATPSTSPDKAEVSGSSPLRPTPANSALTAQTSLTSPRPTLRPGGGPGRGVDAGEGVFDAIDHVLVRCGEHGGPTLPIRSCRRILDTESTSVSDHYGLVVPRPPAWPS